MLFLTDPRLKESTHGENTGSVTHHTLHQKLSSIILELIHQNFTTTSTQNQNQSKKIEQNIRN